MDDIIHAMNVIWGKAEDIQNWINGEAEDVGCNYVGCNYVSESTKQKIREAMEASHE